MLGMILLAAALLACRKSNKDSGCTTDSDCKGTRVCVQGACQDQTTTTSVGAEPARDPALAPGAPAAATSTLKRAVITVKPGRGPGIVRVRPDFEAPPAGTLQNGTEVGILRESDDTFWAFCRFPYPNGTSEGWIHKDILETTFKF